MNIKKAFVVLSIVTLSLGFVSCSDDPEDEPPVADSNGITFSQPGTFKWDITHTFGAAPFALAPASYVTMANDTIRISQLSYYISNIVLTTVNGTKVPMGGYFLQSVLPGTPNTITVQNIPVGTYKSISYLIGVDSAANSTHAHTGALDPNYGMYWTWETGYVFVRLKGRYSEANIAYNFDIGGTQNGINMSHDLFAYKVKGTTITASIKFDLAKVFNAPNIYDLKTDPNNIHADNDPGIDKLSANIQHAFSITAIH